MIENKTTSDCTIYAFVGTAILAISLVVAMYVGNDFHQSLFVESIIFVGSNILLWAIFISMVNYPYELMTIGSNSKTKKNVVEAEPATEQELHRTDCSPLYNEASAGRLLRQVLHQGGQTFQDAGCRRLCQG